MSPETKGPTAHVPLTTDKEKERDRLTREALADVDAGRVIAHQTVQAWVDNLSPQPA